LSSLNTAIIGLAVPLRSSPERLLNSTIAFSVLIETHIRPVGGP
jgi:hypothetical protein